MRFLVFTVAVFFILVSCEKEQFEPGPGDVKILEEGMLDSLSLDMFGFDTVYVDGDSIYLDITHSGGCGEHDYNLWKMPPGGADNTIELIFEHKDYDDPCDAIVYKQLAFCLIPLREDGKSEVRFLMRNNPVMSSYYGEFVYRY